MDKQQRQKLLQQVKEAFKWGPNLGNRQSEWNYEEHQDGVLLRLFCDWRARNDYNEVLVVALEGQEVVYADSQEEVDEGEERQTKTTTVQELAESLAYNY